MIADDYAAIAEARHQLRESIGLRTTGVFVGTIRHFAPAENCTPTIWRPLSDPTDWPAPGETRKEI